MKNLKKLVYISQSIIPSTNANSIHVVNMCQSLTGFYEEVTLFQARTTFIQSKENNKFDIIKYYGVTPKFKLISIPWFKIKGMAFFYALVVFFKTLSFFSAPPSIVYSRCLYSAFLHCLLKKGPIIYETHAMPRSYLHSVIEKYVFTSKKNISVVMITEALKLAYRDKFPCDEMCSKFFVAPDGAALSLLNDKINSRRIPLASRVNVVYTGSLLPGKGGELVVDIARQMKDVDFTIVGGSLCELEKLKHQGLENLHLVGRVSPTEAIEYQRGADILLLPNQPSVLCDNGRVDIGAWTSPLKLFEYMTSGKPIIASDLEVLKEILDGKVNCLLADPSNPADWIKCIRLLIEDPVLTMTISKQAFQDVKDNYTWDARAEKIVRSLKCALLK